VDDDGFREFVALRYGDLLRTAYALTADRQHAEDLVQNALLKVMRRWSQVDEPMAYLRRTIVNQHLSVWRRARRMREWLTSAVPDRPAGGDTAERVAERDELFEALHRLPPRMTAVLVLRYWEDMSEAETAEVLGCSAGAVKSQASRGLARLRAILRADPATVAKES
jgi:RNA polymerase sigma-70 factor (sigma-E family)